ncbi:MAG: RHS repeat-associated core domain-containing protein [Polyangiales bacterium]
MIYVLAALAGCTTGDAREPTGAAVQRDETPPGWPEGAAITVTLRTPTRVRLEWPAASGGSGTPVKYRVYRDGALVSYDQALARLEAGLAAGSSHTWAVRAVDPVGNETAAVDALTVTAVTLPESAAPAWPNNHEFAATRVGKRAVELRWAAATDDHDELRYHLRVKDVATGVWTDVGTWDGAPGETLTRVADGLTPNTAYSFEASVRDFEDHPAAWTRSVLVTTLTATAAPTWPAGAALTATATSDTALRLAWPEASIDTTHYRVFRVDGGAPALLADTTERAWDVSGLSFGGSYAFEVEAVDDDDLTSATRLARSYTLRTPAPEDVAPPLPSREAAAFSDGVAFLYTGGAGVLPPQRNVPAGTIVAARASVLRGRVFRRTPTGNVAAEGARVTVVGHPEYGETWTTADGWYTLAVNGGGTLRAEVTLAGYLPMQRAATVPWSEWALLDDIVMSAEAPAVTVTVDADAGVADGGAGVLGPAVTGAGGVRRGGIFLPAGTRARACLAGSTETTCASPTALTGALHLSITEFTVENDADTMPGALPPNSAFTYAAEYRVAEAESLGAVRVEFRDAADAPQPVVVYVDNFLDLRRQDATGDAGAPAGFPVPAGWYDRAAGRWVPNEAVSGWNELGSGRAVHLLGDDGAGHAVVDTDGDGDGDTDLGLSDDERAWLLANYPPGAGGRSLWRVPVTHLTPWDLNLNREPLDDEDPGSPDDQPLPEGGAGGGPAGSSSVDNREPDDCPPPHPGSLIGCDGRTLGERIALPGLGFELNYRNFRQAGWRSSIPIPLTVGTLRVRGSNAPATMPVSVRVEVEVAGQRFEKTFGPPPGETRVASGLTTEFSVCADPPAEGDFCWDGRDAFGRRVFGAAPVRVRVGYVYAAQYGTTDRFGYAGNESGGITVIPMAGAPSREAMAFWSQRTAYLHAWDDRARGLGGWSLDVHHQWDPATFTVHLGDGQDIQRADRREAWMAERVVGAGYPNATGCTVEGGDPFPYADPLPYDGIPARASGAEITSIAFDPAGELYLTVAQGMVYRLADDQTLRLVFDGRSGVTRDYQDLAFGPDGALYVADGAGHRVWRWKDGVLAAFAGTGAAAPGGVIAPGEATSLPLDTPHGVAVAPDGTVYISEFEGHRVRRVGVDGQMTTYAGNGAEATGCWGGTLAPEDGTVATGAALCHPDGLAVAPDGTLWFTEMNSVLQVGTDGRTHCKANCASAPGSPSRWWLPCGLNFGWRGADGVRARDACLEAPVGVSFDRHGDPLVVERTDREGAGFGSLLRLDSSGIVRVFAGKDDESCGLHHHVFREARRPLFWSARRAAVSPAGEVFALSRLGRVVWRFPKHDDEVRVPSKDGGEVYVFNDAGRHLRTEDAFTGNPRYTFDYDAEGRLAHLRRRVSPTLDDVTTIARSGNVVTLTGPDGDQASLTLDADGYVARVRTSVGGEHALRYAGGGLLRAYQDAAARWHLFEYDDRGRLTHDRWGASETTALAGGRDVATAGGAWSYALSTAGSVTHAARTMTLDDPPYARTEEHRTLPDGRRVRISTTPGRPLVESVRELASANGWDATDHINPMRETRTTVTEGGVRNTEGGWATAPWAWSRRSVRADPFFRGHQPMAGRDEVRHGGLRYASETQRAVPGAALPPSEPRFATELLERFRWVNPLAYDDAAGTLFNALPLSVDDVPQRWETRWTRASTSAPWTVERRSPMNRLQTTVMDGEGRPATITPPPITQDGSALAVLPVVYAYDARGRAETVTQGDRVLRYTWHATGGPGVQGRVASVEVSGPDVSLTTSYLYDPPARRATTVLPGDVVGAERRLVTEDDTSGNLVSLTPPARTAHTFSYGWRNQLASYVAPAAGAHTAEVDRRTSHAYDASGRETQVHRAGEVEASPANTGVTTTYGTGGRVAYRDLPPEGGVRPRVTYGYHATLGDLETVTDSRASVGTVRTLFDVGATGRLTRGTRWELAGVSPSPEVSWTWAPGVERTDTLTVHGAPAVPTLRFVYDGDGAVRRVAIEGVGTQPDYDMAHDPTAGTLQSTTLGGVVTQQRYTAYGQLASLGSVVGSTAGLSFTYGWDGIGRVQRITETNGSPSTDLRYQYDAAGRLSDVCVWDASGCATALAHHEYDPNGNRTLTRYRDASGAVLDEITAAYDAQDRLTGTTGTASGTTTYAYDAQGRTTTKMRGGEVTTYDYDAFGHLTGVTRTGGSTPVAVSYALDATGRRIGRTVASATTHWVYRGERVAGELDADWALQRVFVYGAREHVPDVVMQRTGGGWEAHRVLTDHLGSVRRVVRASDGAVVEERDYDEYGRVTRETKDAAWAWLPFGYAGGLYDRDTGLVRFGARDYDAEVGRWVEKDPIGFAGGDSGLYGYVLGNPVNLIDVDGEQAIPTVLPPVCYTSPQGAAVCGGVILMGAVPTRASTSLRRSAVISRSSFAERTLRPASTCAPRPC